MAKRIAISTLNASTLDILNTIRANAPAEYQENVPEALDASDIPKVGEALFGYPALANHFLTSLVNRIALVRVKSATFNNKFAPLKKGFLEFGETVEEVFVNIAKAREFSVDKAKDREFKRTLPDVRSAFHCINWRVQYPITIENDELRRAFMSIGGVEDMIAKIVQSVYTAAEYDEYLLFKYLIIKGVTKGKMHPVAVDTTDMDNSAIAFRGYSNSMTLMSKEYNASGVTTVTDKADQYIFMDTHFNAKYDVKVLASAFNMNEATFAGNLMLVDNWNTFDNERFSEIVAESGSIEEVTEDELAIMSKVKAILVDKEWFQVYDNLVQFTEKYVSSGLYWNYFYNVWKTVSYSPFSNAVVFVDSTADVALEDTYTVVVNSKVDNESAGAFTLEISDPTNSLAQLQVEFVYDDVTGGAGIGITKYGAYLVPSTAVATTITPRIKIQGVEYIASAGASFATIKVGDTFELTKSV